jgi:hypothetical protein
MPTTSESLIKHKMLWIQGKLHIINKVDATPKVLCTKVTEEQYFCLNFNL